MSKITDMLKKAGGANYDSKQNDASAEPNEAFASMKDSASRKFGEMEKQGNVKGTATTAVRRPLANDLCCRLTDPRSTSHAAVTVWLAVYSTGPLSTTPMDLNVRATTVGATSFKSNVRDLKTA